VSGRPQAAFFGHRLQIARELQGLAQQDLADWLSVSPAAVSQYEKNRATPTEAKIQQAADRLQVPPAFFSVDDTGADKPAFFRSLRSAPAIERKRARHMVQLVHQIACEVETRVRLPRYNVPAFKLTEQDDVEDAEDAAQHVRAAWQLPPGAIEHVVRTVERHGVVVARLASGHERIDAFSVPFPDRPAIMMSEAKGKRDRSRFDVAHELGHLVMHESGQHTTKHAEDQAQRFASAFLMPAADITPELPSYIDWQRLTELKRRWQVALQALLYRARDLDIITDRSYTQAMKTMSARGWRKDEPIDLGSPETPVMLTKALEVAQIDEEELAERTAIPQALLHDVLALATESKPEVQI
jgi:Zn-dependent peptidase ImmA (M78 family)